MTFQDRIKELNERYGFISKNKDFPFSFSPERIAVRHEALLRKDRELYRVYLEMQYPDHLDVEIALYQNFSVQYLYICRISFRAISPMPSDVLSQPADFGTILGTHGAHRSSVPYSPYSLGPNSHSYSFQPLHT